MNSEIRNRLGKFLKVENYWEALSYEVLEENDCGTYRELLVRHS